MPLELGSALSIEREPWDDPEIRVEALESIYLIIVQVKLQAFCFSFSDRKCVGQILFWCYHSMSKKTLNSSKISKTNYGASH
jgi:hypothetical protein